jgi:hypothetical protein
MARTLVDINDLVSVWKNKTNEISYKVGDLAELRTIEDSDMVGAINELWGLARLDSNGITDLISDQFFPLTSAQLAGPVSLILYDSAGVTVKTIFGANI